MYGGMPVSCDDGNACVYGGEWVLAAVACAVAADDGDPCTVDVCAVGRWEYVVVSDDTPCADADEYDGIETCRDGLCSAGAMRAA